VAGTIRCGGVLRALATGRDAAGPDGEAGVSSIDDDEGTRDASDVPGAAVAREDGDDTIAGGGDAGSVGEEMAAAGDVSAGDGGAGDAGGADDGVAADEGAGSGDGADVTRVTGATRAVDKIE